MLIISQLLTYVVLKLTEFFVCVVCIYVLFVCIVCIVCMYCRDTGGLERVASITNSYYKFAEAGKSLFDSPLFRPGALF